MCRYSQEVIGKVKRNGPLHNNRPHLQLLWSTGGDKTDAKKDALTYRIYGILSEVGLRIVLLTFRIKRKFPRANLGEIVDAGKFQQSASHEAKTHDDKPVEGRGIGHLGEVVSGVHAQGRQCQH